MAQTLKGLKGHMGGLGGVVSNPYTRLAIRYWWLAIPVGLAAWGKYQEKKAQGKVRLHHILGTLGETIAPVTAIIALGEFARRDEARQFQKQGPNIRDAEFEIEQGYPQPQAQPQEQTV